MNNRKCAFCELVNFPTAALCKRCGAALDGESGAREISTGSIIESNESNRRTLCTRAIAVLGMVRLLVLAGYISLLETSEPLSYEQKQIVDRAIAIIEERGFERDAFLLRRLTKFRATDNWWNEYVGHGDAYAATNFPFEVVTLYPDFFIVPVDDTERAAILLHEARHLAGAGEENAFASVWRDKARLGWTAQSYGESRVWRNTREFTLRFAPQLFRCGTNNQSDCFQ